MNLGGRFDVVGRSPINAENQLALARQFSPYGRALAEAWVDEVGDAIGLVNSSIPEDISTDPEDKYAPRRIWERGLTGKPYDPELELYWFGYRWYSPSMRRWTQQEPLGLDGPNLYHYVIGNPVQRLDEDGLWNIGIHQGSIERVLGDILSPQDLQTLTDFQAVFDSAEWQERYPDSEVSPRHAMRCGPCGQTVEEARDRANYVLSWYMGMAKLLRQMELAMRRMSAALYTGAQLAMDAGGRNNWRLASELKRKARKLSELASFSHNRSLQYLSASIHMMQDATSPPHGPWDPWDKKADPRLWRSMHICKVLTMGLPHALSELFDPGSGSALDQATEMGWKMYTSAVPIPDDYF